MSEPIHNYFGLTYSKFIVLHRSIMQSMPVEWQKQMVELLEQADEAAANLPGMPPSFTLVPRDSRGRIVADPYLDYERGRRRVPLQEVLLCDPCREDGRSVRRYATTADDVEVCRECFDACRIEREAAR